MAEYIHPSVSSRIVDNSTTFVTAQGTTKLFAAFTSDKGKDNKIQEMSTPSEFEFNYGKANMKRHGQAAYNAINWLQSGGGVYALRLLPENAGFSHAFINIQTKKGTKKVKDVNEKLVAMPNVTVRPTVTYAKTNNTSLKALEAELSKKDRQKTVDGFDNNFLLAIVPKGRGKEYDRFGFRLSLTNNYDETYDFRVYNFETVEFTDSGEVKIVEGPFQVSLLPEAMSHSNESMFIKYVIEKYSLYYETLFSEEVYNKLIDLYNADANVSAGSIDLLTGQTRKVGGEKEKFFSSITQKEEDIHINLHKYNEKGEAVNLSQGEPELNFVETDSEVQKSIVEIDDEYRTAQYNRKLKASDRMRLALSRFRQNAFGTLVASLATPLDGTELKGGKLKEVGDKVTTAFAELKEAEEAYNAAPSDELMFKLNAKLLAVKSVVNEANSVTHECLDIARSVGETTSIFDTTIEIQDIENSLHIADVTKISTASKKEQIITTKAELALSKTSDEDSTRLEGIVKGLSSVEDAIRFAQIIQKDDAEQADQAIKDAKEAYGIAYMAYEAAIDVYALPEEIEGNIANAISQTEKALEKVKLALDLCNVEVVLSAYEEIKTKMTTVVSTTVDALKEATTKVDSAKTVEEKKLITDTIKSSVDKANADALIGRSALYNVDLHSLDSYIKFSAGSDGDLDESNPKVKAQTTKNLLISAFSGLIDPDVANKKLYPIDLVLDANHDIDVKNAMSKLVIDIRNDFMAFVDTGFQANPAQAEAFRKQFPVSNERVAIFTQDFIVYDNNTGQDIKVTSPYFLASKIPSNDEQFGIHYNFVGPRRGNISGYKHMSFNPTEQWKETLYKNQINYVEADNKRTKFATQLTSQRLVSALSNIDNVRALLRIQRESEELMEDYLSEYFTESTISDANTNLNNYLAKWKTNGACTEIEGTVYADDYSRQNKTLNVKVILKFTETIERIALTFSVNR